MQENDQQRIFNSIDPQPDELLQPKRFIREGKVTYFEGNKGKERYLFLFNDCLLICSTANKKHMHKLYILLKLRKDLLLENCDGEKFILKAKRDLVFNAPSVEDKEFWVTDMQFAIDGNYTIPTKAERLKLDEPYDPYKALDGEKQQVFDAFKAKLESRDPPLTDLERTWLDDGCLCRYLRARDYDIGRAYEMISNSLKWRAEYKPESITAEEVDAEAASGKIYVSDGKDMHGRPIVYLRPGLDTKVDVATKLKYCVYILEHASEAMNTSETGIEKMSWIVDFTDSSVGQADSDSLQVAKDCLMIVQDHYPERLGQAFVLNPPFLFWAFWKVLSPFADPVTKKKIQFFRKKSEYKKLLLYIEADELEEMYGGTKKFIYDHEEWRQTVDSPLIGHKIPDNVIKRNGKKESN